MALFRRNVVGSDLISLWRYIEKKEPVDRDKIVAHYYPGDAGEESESSNRKTLHDAVDFLLETDQVVEGEDGFDLSESARNERSPRTALLLGIRSREGEDAAYNDVLDVLTEEDLVYFDRGDPLEDLLSGRRSEATWNSTRLNYWRRVMEALGVVRDLNTDTDESYTTMLSVNQETLGEVLYSVVNPNELTPLQEVLDALHDRYLPVFAGTNREVVATYFDRALRLADSANRIQIEQKSDFGPSVDIGGSGVNALTLRVSNTP